MVADRGIVSTVIEVASAGAVCAGAFLFAVPVGLVVSGVFGLLFARGLAR